MHKYGLPSWQQWYRISLPMQEMKEMGSIPRSGRSSGVGNGNPLQYPCLENSMDKGAWQATVLGVANSQTQLNDWIHTQRTCIPLSTRNTDSSMWKVLWKLMWVLRARSRSPFALIIFMHGYCFCFMLWCFGKGGMWDLTSPTMDRTSRSCTGRQSLNHQTTREVPTCYILLPISR